MVRRKLNNIRHYQKPKINQMISFKKRAGRYQAMKNGKMLEMRVVEDDSKHRNTSINGRGSIKDDLYQSMNEEGALDGDNFS